MASYEDFIGQGKDLVSETLFGETGLGEMSSNLSEEIDALSPGDLKYQFRAWIVGLEDGVDSNISYWRFAARVIVYYMVEDLASESGFTERDMLTFQTTFLDPDSWRDLASVYVLEANPETSAAPEMSGGVVSVEFELLALVPVD